ncbi:uncharacterized protein PHACADRAFT_94269, partial [Phanerochaete carnosa HHB-10118-sp]
RGEQFRHQQNLLRSPSHIPTSLQTKPTLPLAQIFGTGSGSSDAGMRPQVTLVEGVPTYAYPNGAVPGPRPPRSWMLLFDEGERREPKWRAIALRLLFEDLRVPPWVCDVREEGEGGYMVPPLALECARMLLEAYGDTEDWAEVARYIPAHVRRDLVRWYAVRKPLGNATLYTLYGEEAHAEGELLVVGPEATLRRVALVKGKQTNRRMQPAQSTEREEATWDEFDSWDEPGDTTTPLTTFALVMTPLPNELLTYLPPTLTHLALLALPQPVRVYRLPEISPLLETLDLSYNDWLSNNGSTAEGSLERVPWRRWQRLRVLGLRVCGIGADIATKVNVERWTDVEIVGLDEPISRSTSNRES